MKNENKKSDLQILKLHSFKLSEKLLVEKQRTKSFLVSKNKISQSIDIFIDIVKIRAISIAVVIS